MTGGSLRRAGWLAMISAIITLPLFWWSLASHASKDLQGKIIESTIQVVGTLLFVWLSLLLRRFLNRRFAFHGTDRIINLMIISNLVIGILSLLGTAFPGFEEVISQVLILVAITMGVLQARFGYLLLSVPDELGGLRRPYAYLNIITGICLASIVLVPIAIVCGAIADVMLGTIFLHSARSISTTA